MSTAFQVVLDGSQETPPNDSTATGHGTVIFDSDAVTATYSFRIDGLDFGPATGAPPQTPETDDDVINAHFHNQVRGVAGPVVFGQIGPAQDNDDLSIVHNPDAVVQNADGSWTVSGRWDTTDPANVSITNFADTLGSAAVGSEVPLYWNVHTPPFPAGEIRGQLVAIADDNDNVVTGTPGDDLLPGLGGNDVIHGLAGNDTIDGGDGNDSLFGGPGDDIINTGPGADVVHGGSGNDIIQVNAPEDTAGDNLFGGSGNDIILGGDVSSDEIHGGAGDDLIQAFGTSPEAATAGDRLFGGPGNDTVIGGNAADIIDGGRGDDVLTGNGGADTFVFRNNGAGNDVILDFNPSNNVVQLAGFDASFNPMEALSTQALGTVLDLGGGNSVLFAGLTPADLKADDFQMV